MISPLAYIDPSAKLGKNVIVHPFAYIDKNVEIGDNNVIMPYASLLSGTRMGNDNIIYQGAVIASVPQDFYFKGDETLAYIGNNNVIREHAVITRGTFPDHATRIGDHNFIMQDVRISHDVEVGNGCIVGNGTQVSGECKIFDKAILTSHVLMQGHTRIGSYSIVQGGCRFIKDIPPFIVAAHDPTTFYSLNTKILEYEGFSEAIIKQLAQAYRIIYKTNTSIKDALSRIEEQIPKSEEMTRLVNFIRTSKLGIID